MIIIIIRHYSSTAYCYTKLFLTVYTFYSISIVIKFQRHYGHSTLVLFMPIYNILSALMPLKSSFLKSIRLLLDRCLFLYPTTILVAIRFTNPTEKNPCFVGAPDIPRPNSKYIDNIYTLSICIANGLELLRWFMIFFPA